MTLDAVEWAMLAVSTVLYVRLGERGWALFVVRDPTDLTAGLGLIRVLATCLPLLGLLGTIGGMIEAFGALGHMTAGGSVAQTAGGGIARALVATQQGLALAVPAVLADGLLRRQAEKLAA